LQLAESVGDAFIRLRRVVDHHRKQESLIRRHQVRTINRELPFEAEVPLDTRVCIRGDDRDEESAIVNLPADLPVPGFSAPELALIEPNLDSGGAKCLANLLGRPRIL
jgi:hypothetical protein